MKYQIKITHVPNEETEIFESIEEVIETFENIMDAEQIAETLENKDSDFKVEFLISL